MGDDSETGALRRPGDRRKQLAGEVLIELEAVDIGSLETLDDGRRLVRRADDVEPAADDGGALLRLLGGEAHLAAEEIPRTAHAAAVEAVLHRRLPVVRVAQVVDRGHAVRQEKLALPVAVVHVRVDEARQDELAACVDDLGAGGRGARGRHLRNHPVPNEHLGVVHRRPAGAVDERPPADQERLGMELPSRRSGQETEREGGSHGVPAILRLLL